MRRRLIAGLCSMVLVAASLGPVGSGRVQAQQSQSVGTTYYVSSKSGDNSNSGTSKNSPWETLDKLSGISLSAGDQVLLESGSVFDGYIHLKEVSGTEEAPIVISSYGEGNAPRIDTKGQGVWYQNYGKSLDNNRHKKEGYVSSSILLYDTEYIEINGIEVTNHGIDGENYSGADKMNRTGVAVVAQNKGTLDHIHLKNLNVHDVNGNVADKHMNNGGIYLTVFQPNDEAATGISRYNDILIEGCTVQNTSRWGIAAAYTAYWNHFTSTAIPDETAQEYGMTNVVIQNNYIKDVGGDAITTMYCYRPLIQYNVSDGAAKEMNEEVYPGDFGRVAAGIWPWKCKDAVFQYNEVFDMVYNQDAQAWDADSGDGTIYQYNYSHNNEGGCVMFCYPESYRNIFRYNISESDLDGVMNPSYNPDAHVYNNTFYVAEGVDFLRTGQTGGNMKMENNIIYYAGGQPKEESWFKGGTNVEYSNNLYYNYVNVPENDALAITENPRLKNPGSGPKTALAKVHGNAGGAFSGYQLESSSPAVNRGKYIMDNGGLDFFGKDISGHFCLDIGAFESDQPDEVVKDIYSSVYKINLEKKTIKDVPKQTKAGELKEGLLAVGGTILTVKNAGTVLGDEDVVPDGAVLEAAFSDGVTDTYTIFLKKEYAEYDVAGMTAEVGSFQPNNNTEGGGNLALDDNLSTLWHTNWDGCNQEDVWISIDMGSVKPVSMLKYVPRQTGGINGMITKYEIWVSDTGAEGSWTKVTTEEDTWKKDKDTKYAYFDTVNTRYVKLLGVESATDTGKIFGSAAEIRLGYEVQ